MGRGPALTAAQIERFWVLRRQGFTQTRAAIECGFSQASAKKLERLPSNGQDYRALKEGAAVPDRPVPFDDVTDDAWAALTDRSGLLFAQRYQGIELAPWQQLMWSALEESYLSPDREYLLVNGPPGGGKSTVLVLFCAKQIAANRAVRVMFISRAQRLADRNSRALRRLLERTGPPEGAASTLSKDFGRFKPKSGGDVWKAAEGVVEQMDGTPIENMEPTFCAFGFDSEWIGFRVNIMAGDDLDTSSSIRNMDIVEGRRQIFDDELEPRIESGGLLALAQQRLGAFDFSAHVEAKRIIPDDLDPDSDSIGDHQYKRLVFRAHYEDRCTRQHSADSPPYPAGCLLNPAKLGWRDLRKQMNKPSYNTVYQQEDPTFDQALVQQDWIDGIGDHPGCWDRDRDAGQIPKGLAGTTMRIVTADPSPTRYWAVQDWLYHPDTEQRFLIDLIRQSLDAPDFLDWDYNNNCFTGLLEDWWQRSNDQGQPITHVIVEINAAQRFLLQYDHVRRWSSLRKVLILGHSTHRNKADPKLGVESIAPHYQYGRIRLPGKSQGRLASMKLISEVTRWPSSSTDDCVMAHWFLEWNLPQLRPRVTPFPRVMHTPSWA